MSKSVTKAAVKAMVADMHKAVEAVRRDSDDGKSWRSRRSEETRAALMDAAVQILAEQGFAQTTTQRVADKVGVSRGAMVHHYATRRDLIAAVIDYLCVQLMAMAYAGVDDMSARGGVDMDGALDLHWRIVSTPEYQAFIELKIAARTDAELCAVFDPRALAFDQLWNAKIQDLFPYWGEKKDKRAARAWSFARTVLEGLKINERTFGSPAVKKDTKALLLDVLQRIQRGEV